MQFYVLGLNHKTAPIKLRERFSIVEDALALTAERVRQIGLEESFVVSTCNRVELYGAGQLPGDFTELLGQILADVGETSFGSLSPHLYQHTGSEAIHHLFRVAASLDSMVVGEPQILGQLKSAYALCRKAGVTGPLLNRTVERAFSVAKRVRSETGIGRHVVSISSVAVQLAKQIFGELDSRAIALIGAGKMGELAAGHLKDAGAQQLYVANRSFDRAQALASKLNGHPRKLDELSAMLVAVDIVITSTGATEHIISAAMMRKVMRARKYRPIFFIDIAVPRNVEPALIELDNVYVYDVDDLNGVAQKNRLARADEARIAEAVVREQAAKFTEELAGLAVKPTIVALQRQMQTLKATELMRIKRRLSADQDDVADLLDQLADGLLNKVLHGAIMELKRSSADGDRVDSIEVVRRIYGLDKEETE